MKRVEDASGKVEIESPYRRLFTDEKCLSKAGYFPAGGFL
jgi:hypothetical protein